MHPQARAFDIARAEIGTVEWAKGDNPKVIAYFRDAGHPEVSTDATAWCAAFVGAVLKRAGLKGTGSLAARSYLQWGEEVPLAQAEPGDIVVFKRGNSTWQGHVAFFVKRAGAMIECLGGNQSDQVKIARYALADLLSVRRCVEPVAQPVPPPVAAPTSTPKPVVAPEAAPEAPQGGLLARLIASIVAAFFTPRRP